MALPIHNQNKSPRAQGKHVGSLTNCSTSYDQNKIRETSVRCTYVYAILAFLKPSIAIKGWGYIECLLEGIGHWRKASMLDLVLSMAKKIVLLSKAATEATAIR